MNPLLEWAPLLFPALLIIGFGALALRFLSVENMGAILVQSCWLIVVALVMSFVLPMAAPITSSSAGWDWFFRRLAAVFLDPTPRSEPYVRW